MPYILTFSDAREKRGAWTTKRARNGDLIEVALPMWTGRGEVALLGGDSSRGQGAEVGKGSGGEIEEDAFRTNADF